MSYKLEITNDEIKKLPKTEFSGNIFLIDTFKKFDIALPLLSEKKILGFDTETKPAFKKGKENEVALLQLSDSETAFLFRLQKIGMPDPLIRILEKDSIKKVGVAIRDDLRALKKVKSFNPAGFVELQEVASEMGLKNNGLKKLAGIFLGYRISKSQRMTNWENEILSPGQLKYAATDAWICNELYYKMVINKE
jgi:ribonuclease D